VKILDLFCGDALPWLRSLATSSVDLWVTSPPYEDARAYGGLRIPRGEAWVTWYTPYVVEMCRTAKTFAAVNVAGLVRRFTYSAVDMLLVADLMRNHGIVLGPQPYAWVKSAGMPGKSHHYHRRDWEPVYLFAEAAKLQRNPPVHWSDNLAYGEPPKFKPGGAFSYSKRVRTGGRANDTARPPYVPPAIANPGNVIRCPNGGGHTGHEKTTGNEAPMNLAVAERLVRWYAPPSGLVGDPMCGSGTTGHAALMHGRRFIGCDLRASQILTTRQRLAGVTMVEPKGKQ
jgi:site-specific DNA-methyltransferase (adenine-specific)